MLNWKTGAPKPEGACIASGIHWHTDKTEMFSYHCVLHAPHAREVSPSHHHYPNYSEMDEMLATLCVWVSAAHVAAMCWHDQPCDELHKVELCRCACLFSGWWCGQLWGDLNEPLVGPMHSKLEVNRPWSKHGWVTTMNMNELDTFLLLQSMMLQSKVCAHICTLGFRMFRFLTHICQCILRSAVWGLLRFHHLPKIRPSCCRSLVYVGGANGADDWWDIHFYRWGNAKAMMQSLACFHTRSVPEEHELPVTSPSRMEATAACMLMWNFRWPKWFVTCMKWPGSLAGWDFEDVHQACPDQAVSFINNSSQYCDFASLGHKMDIDEQFEIGSCRSFHQVAFCRM